ncbi:hypothetical protein BGX27_004337 [Mortierella sp. AM989]|nr:hypothetical protein BGX27_004337 [Mortierella sp. AM989]
MVTIPDTNPGDNYFDRYPDFTLGNNESPKKAFKRLMESEDWDERKMAVERAVFQLSIGETPNLPIPKGHAATSVNYFNNHPSFIRRRGEHARNAFKRLAEQKNWTDQKKLSEQVILVANIYQGLHSRPASTIPTGSTRSVVSNTDSDTSSEADTDDDIHGAPIMNYFNRFPDFTLKRGELARNAFKRLAKMKGWSEMRRNLEKANLQRCVTQELNDRFCKLEHLQDLCMKLLKPPSMPSSITQCEKMLKTIYVNIWDICEGKYKTFPDFKSFQKYTSHGRTFNRENAKALKFKVFLRVLSGSGSG